MKGWWWLAGALALAACSSGDSVDVAPEEARLACSRATHGLETLDDDPKRALDLMGEAITLAEKAEEQEERLVGLSYMIGLLHDFSTESSVARIAKAYADLREWCSALMHAELPEFLDE